MSYGTPTARGIRRPNADETAQLWRLLGENADDTDAAIGALGTELRTGLQAALASVTADVAAAESRTSTSYGNLTTVAPSVSVAVKASGLLFVVVSARIISASAADGGLMAFALLGANIRSESDADALRLMGTSNQRASAVTLLTGLTPGSTTVLAKYASASGASATFANRRVTAVAL